jgi:3,4-dihydroxy 2-butanone 4-phosphate synthase/GTP cyclohydrolase II
VRTELGEFDLFTFESAVDALPHVVLSAGGVGVPDSAGVVKEDGRPTLVRVHRRHLLGDVFGDVSSSPEGPTGATLRAAMKKIQEEGRGAIVYLRPEGSALDAGLEHALQRIRRPAKKDADAPDLTSPTAVPPSSRELGIGSQIIRQLGLSKLRLLTNHTTDWPGLEAFGIQIVERVPLSR